MIYNNISDKTLEAHGYHGNREYYTTLKCGRTIYCWIVYSMQWSITYVTVAHHVKDTKHVTASNQTVRKQYPTETRPVVIRLHTCMHGVTAP